MITSPFMAVFDVTASTATIDDTTRYGGTEQLTLGCEVMKLIDQ